MHPGVYLLFLVGILLSVVEAAEEFQCEGKDSIEKEVLTTSCGKSITVQSPVGVVASNHMYKVIPSCLNCSLILTTEEGYQLTAMFHTFGTETGPGGACSKNRLDVYSGAMPVKEDLLSNATGLCGCDLPKQAYKSSGNFLTLGFSTKCDNVTQHGEFELIISAFKKEEKVNVTRCPGKFECANGMACLNKTLVCNGKSDCKDNSDETGCEKKSESKLTPLYFYILVGLAGVCFIFLLVIMILLCYRFCCQSKIAAAYERFK